MSENKPQQPRLRIVSWRRPGGDHPIYGAIGNIAAEWAYLEHVLDQIIGDMLQGTDNARLACLTSQMMGTGPRFRAIKALLKIEAKAAIKPLKEVASPENLISKLNALEQKSFNVSERRNRIVHDPWYLEFFSSEPAQFRSMPTKDPVYGMKLVQKQFLAETFEQIADLVEATEKLRAKIYDALTAWKPDFLPRPLAPPRNSDAARDWIMQFLEEIPVSDSDASGGEAPEIL
jgi:hypothetical protein